MSCKTKGIVVVGHGLVHEPRDPSDTSPRSAADRARLQKALSIIEYEGVNKVFFTQDVPSIREPLATTVAECNANVLRLLRPLLHHSVLYRIIPGRNQYDQCWNTCRIARRWKVCRLTVIASQRYFDAFGAMWRRAGERNDLCVSLIAASAHQGPSEDPIIDTHDINGWDLFLARMATAGGRVGHYVSSILADLAISDNSRV